MDPEATLKELRELMAGAVEGNDGWTVLRMAELFQVLDEWLRAGNATPAAWEKPQGSILPPLRVGQMLYGPCDGVFPHGSDSPKRIEAIGFDWLVCRNAAGWLEFANTLDVDINLALNKPSNFLSRRTGCTS